MSSYQEAAKMSDDADMLQPNTSARYGSLNPYPTEISISSNDNITSTSTPRSNTNLLTLVTISTACLALGYHLGKNSNDVNPPSMPTTTTTKIPLEKELHSLLLDRLPHDHPSQNQQYILGSTTNQSTNNLIYLDDNPTSIQMLTSSPTYSTDYYLYNAGMDVQIDQAYCSVATASTVLNTFRFVSDHSDLEEKNVPIGLIWKGVSTSAAASASAPTSASASADDGDDNDDDDNDDDDNVGAPLDLVYDPYHYVTQTDVFSWCSWYQGVNPILVDKMGMSLNQFASVVQCRLDDLVGGGNVTVRHLDPDVISVDEMREELKSALMDGNSKVALNYDRRMLGQEGGGHFGPLASYNNQTDSFLILDVAKYKYPPVWVPTSTLYLSMSSGMDACGDMTNFNVENDGTDRMISTMIRMGIASRHRRDDSSKSVSDFVEDLFDRLKGLSFEDVFHIIQQVLGCKALHRGYAIVTSSG